MSQKITEELFALRDETYRKLQCRTIPSLPPETVIGVRTPALRAMAKKMMKESPEESKAFLSELPHPYFDENQLHAFMISEIKDYERCMEEIEKFLPYVDNWATCDQMSPKIFIKHKAELIGKVKRWLKSDHIYTVRFGIGMLLEHYLDEDFDPAYPAMVAKIRSEEYYINMMIAWYFATALAKQYEVILPYLEEGRLEKWTHNKTIQKAVESYRITPVQKEHLKSLRKRR